MVKIFIQILIMKIRSVFRRYDESCGKMPYLAMLKNPLKNSWIRIRMQMTSKI